MPMFQVDSGFNGLAVYKTEAIKGLRYCCEPNHDKYVEAICEHVTFHKHMTDNGHDQIFVNPSQMVFYNSYCSRPKNIKEGLVYLVCKVIQLIRERRMPDKLKYFLQKYYYLYPAHLLYKLKITITIGLTYKKNKTTPAKTSKQNVGIQLLTTFYKESDLDRLNEFKKCIQYNVCNPYISDIHIFYENMRKANVEEFLLHPKIKLHDHDMGEKGNIAYKHFIDFANEKLNDSIVIIANTDIYFDDSLKKLQNYDFENKVLALTRYNDGKYGYLGSKVWVRNTFSQDSWIFKTPLREVFADINLGWCGCDNRIAYEMEKAGLSVLNPSEDIMTWHVHKSSKRTRSEVKTYHNEENYKETTRVVPFSRLR